MSTRCHIIVKKDNDKMYVYRHHDGYPSGVGEDLKEFIKKNINDIHKISVNEFCRRLEDFDCNYEIDDGIHGDEEYIYHIDLNKCKLECHKVPIYDDASENIEGYDNVMEFEYENIAYNDKFTLIVVDEQRGFYHPEGNLYVKGGENAVEHTVALINCLGKQIVKVIATADFHLYDNDSYKEPNAEWPWHCMAYSEDAGIANDVVMACAKNNIPMEVFIKGNCKPHTEYGAFENNTVYLHFNGDMDILCNNRMNNSPVHITTKNVIICGIAGDYCVMNTIKNLLKYRNPYGLNIYVYLNGIASIDDGTTIKNFIKENNLAEM